MADDSTKNIEDVEVGDKVLAIGRRPRLQSSSQAAGEHMDLRDRIADVRRRPRLYGLTTFGEVAAFLTGMDAATDWRFLEGFREWLASRSGLGANLAWQVLVIRIAYPGENNDLWVRPRMVKAAKRLPFSSMNLIRS
ncbi:hypothetical protein DMA15_04835 [Streptomyces sp. WAC 01529]|uniref:hypothetical protein n=1 Tax=Streptomyces sp. WAC 01529 TaxID=2203205 RepID=UPI000F6FD840|nr:hypothetical protein [Streptomyces sp. WAC 01529]AZM51997.1 hypothetical protein DMA15_04835 [Streptomyces sp. WAC 01529]